MHERDWERLRLVANDQDGVVLRRQALDAVGASALRWRLKRGVWQQPARGVVVLHSGPMTRRQTLWADVLVAGRGAALAGLTAAEVAGLRGFADRNDRRWVLVPHGRKVTRIRTGLVVKSSTSFRNADVLSTAGIPRTRPPRALIDAAIWARSSRHAEAILLAGVQQRIVTPTALAAQFALRSRGTPRHGAIARAVMSMSDGGQTLPEAEFLRLCRRERLPLPDAQAHRYDAHGRARWLDFLWRKYGLVAEIDGLAHMNLQEWRADMLRDANLLIDGLRVLRLPNVLVLEESTLVADLVRGALLVCGWTRPEAEAA